MLTDNKLKNSPIRVMINGNIALLLYSFIGLLISFMFSFLFSGDVENGNHITEKVAASILVLIGLVLSVYSHAWKFGLKEYNLVKFKYTKEQKYKGIKIGLLMQIPMYIFLLILWFSDNSTLKIVYEIIAFPFYWLFALAGFYKWGYIFMFAVLPFAVQCGYHFGYNNISIREKIYYKDPHKKTESNVKKDKRLK